MEPVTLHCRHCDRPMTWTGEDILTCPLCLNPQQVDYDHGEDGMIGPWLYPNVKPYGMWYGAKLLLVSTPDNIPLLKGFVSVRPGDTYAAALGRAAGEFGLKADDCRLELIDN
jgi:hypothetical protein